ncbi:MAG: hypothetical protein Q7S52_02750 [bacterium]|nr:hypothetical protein [bacterium]
MEKLLVSLGDVSARPCAVFNPREFLWNGNRACVRGNFDEWILPNTRTVTSASRMLLRSYALTRAANDLEIRRELPKVKAFGLRILWVVARLIEVQSQGEIGALSTDYYPNIFFFNGRLKKFTVVVSRGSGDLLWWITSWNFGGHGNWLSGARIFTPAPIFWDFVP